MQFRFKKLRSYFFLYFLAPAASVFLIILYINGSTSRKKDFQDAGLISMAKAAQYANTMKSAIDSYIAVARTIGDIMENYESIPEDQRRDYFASLLKTTLENRDEFLSVWSICDTNTIDNLDTQYINTVGSSVLGNFRYIYYKDKGEILLSQYIEQDPEEVLTGSLFTMARNSKIEILTDPYYYSYTGNDDDAVLETNIVLPLIKDEQFFGMLGIDFRLESFKALTDSIQVFEDSYAVLISNDGSIVSNPDTAVNGDNIAELPMFTEVQENIIDSIKAGRSFTVKSIDKQGNKLLCAFAPILSGKTTTPWSLMIVVPEYVIFKESNQNFRQSLLIGLIGIILLSLIIILVTNRITKPILANIRAAEQLSEGNLTIVLPESSRQDEIGRLNNSLKVMTDRLLKITYQMKQGSQSTYSAAVQFSQTAQKMSEQAGELAASTEELSANIEQLSAGISENSEQAKNSARITKTVSAKINFLKSAAQSTKEANENIAEKVNVIEDIAFQTNLLSLNASIISAKAGERGKEFNVVAAQVRKLAALTAKASDEIAQLAETSLQASRKTQNELNIVVPELKKAGLLSVGLKDSSIQQLNGITEIRNTILEINKVTQHNSASSEEIASAAEELNSQSEALTKLTEFFKT